VTDLTEKEATKAMMREIAAIGQLQDKQWVGLTDDEITQLWKEYRAAAPRYLCFAYALETRIRRKNT